MNKSKVARFFTAYGVNTFTQLISFYTQAY